jgi:hypothetical protein
LDKNGMRSPKVNTDKASYVGQLIDLPEELVRMRQEMATQLSQGLSIRDHGFVRRMAELLGLNEEQQVGMLRLLEKKREALNVYSSTTEMPQKLLELTEKAEADYHQALGRILDQNQVTKYNNYKKQQAHNRAVANAKTNYADVLRNIDLSTEQQSAVEEALQSNSLANLPTLYKTNALQEAYETMGYGTAAELMATNTGANAAIEQAADKSRMLQDLIESRHRESASQLDALRPVLTTAQWQQYKAILDAKDLSFYMSIQPLMSSAPVEASILDPNAEN